MAFEKKGTEVLDTAISFRVTKEEAHIINDAVKQSGGDKRAFVLKVVKFLQKGHLERPDWKLKKTPPYVKPAENAE